MIPAELGLILMRSSSGLLESRLVVVQPVKKLAAVNNKVMRMVCILFMIKD